MFHSDKHDEWKGAVLMHITNGNNLRALSEMDNVLFNSFTFRDIGELDYMPGDPRFITESLAINSNSISTFSASLSWSCWYRLK